MGVVSDLASLGFDVGKPVEVARGIDVLILTRDQKAGLLKRYLAETGIPLSDPIRAAATTYGVAL